MASTLSEHHSYLIDARRTQLYRRAIQLSNVCDETVADLGCGFGILGLLCLEAGAGRVWGIDATDATDIALETAARAGYGSRYSCIRGQTFRAELPEVVDVLICDHVGYFGIDYGILQLMADAQERFLKPDGRIIPERIHLFLAGVRSDSCRKKLDVWETPEITPEFHWLRSYAVNTKHAVDLMPTDLATEPVPVAELVLGENYEESLAFKATLEVEEDGTLDGIAGWFDCHLAAGVRMTNSPLARDAIDRHQIFLGFDKPLPVKAGDAVEVSVRINHINGILAWTVRDPATGRLQRYSNWAAMPMSAGARLKPGTAPRSLNDKARNLGVVLGYIDGERTSDEIEQAVLRDHPTLLPSPIEISRFVKDVLADYAS
ncbi:MAG: 50S ribosomal protein L11 methyltransferase [Novosphingobium meiothermophilum]